MSALIPFILTFPLFTADLFVISKDGVPTITNQKKSGARVLYKMRDKGGGARDKASRRRAAQVGPTTRARVRAFSPFVKQAEAHYKLPAALIWAVMKTESGFNPTVVSNKGAQGLMQLMPDTGRDMGVTDPFDPQQNILGGARYLRLLANRFNGDLVLTLSGYHAGGGAVNSVGGIPYSQTAEYVRRVLNAYYAYQVKPPDADL
ncbi:lytic transglycosylase domain-containing protein [Myxococcota bacterium]|nr:lytic transglycosylase domain-containing protein [Myxococcota bacterium]MBU1431072.1 lytic transglycosylase domain-containing protein [Myxococcota bacterium]MBU1896516.1 lytic transglycosylase domain-containing protein [Myxococcota bacterium]